MEIVSCDEREWDAFADRSPQGTVFSTSGFLRTLGPAARHFVLRDGGSALGGISLIESGSGIVRPMPYQMFGGIHFADFSLLKLYKRIENEFAVTERLADFVFNEYGEVSLINHWTVRDMRPFDWYHYHQRELGTYAVRVRYLRSLEPSKAELTGPPVREIGDEQLLPVELQAIGRYLLDTGCGNLFQSDRDGKTALVAHDRKSAYFIYGDRALLPTAWKAIAETKGALPIICLLGDRPSADDFPSDMPNGSVTAYFVTSKIPPASGAGVA